MAYLSLIFNHSINTFIVGPMALFNNILFDLDGTLTDSAPGIIHSFQYSLSKLGLREKNENTLMAFIGPPLIETYKKQFGFDDIIATRAIAYYREYFSEKGLYENRLYPGIPALLKELRARGKKIILATAKPEIYARRIIEYFEIDGFFCHVQGTKMDGSIVSKNDVISYIMHTLRLSSTDTVMVGDREDDIRGAKENNIRSIGVTYGYGSTEELIRSGADRIAQSVASLYQLIE